MNNKKKAVFLDRDGVINEEKEYVHKIKDFVFIQGVFKVVKKFNENGYYVFIITNQSGIGRGYYTENDFKVLNKWMLKEFEKSGAYINKVYYCPHSPNDNCSCRKPKPGMILEAIKEFNIDVNRSWLIGDKEDDILAAYNACIKNLVLVRSGHKIDENKTKANFIIDSITDIIDFIFQE